MTAPSHHTGLAVIAVFKVVKGLLLLLLGLGLLKLVHAEIATLFSLLIEALHLNADSRLVHALVLYLAVVSTSLLVPFELYDFSLRLSPSHSCANSSQGIGSGLSIDLLLSE